MEVPDLGENKYLMGAVAVPYVIWKLWQMVKSDQKGDSLDARVQSFNVQLQAQLDKAITRLDALQTEKSALESENATLKAQLQILTAENTRINSNLASMQFKGATPIPSTGNGK